MRGEYCPVAKMPLQTAGSSPRAWGILLYSASDNTRNRFIPTCVGNTLPSFRSCPLASVHPHVRGEYLRHRFERVGADGSSPRAWGIRPCRFPRPCAWRFIPTCVGNTSGTFLVEQLGLVHPHVRGEYVQRKDERAIASGSSPRAWGIQTIKRLMDMGVRFIPTCVGNTMSRTISIPFLSVHPHVRGEYSISRTWASFIRGSSPRAWGIPKNFCPAGHKPRFIPTCVGNTSSVRAQSMSATVHPHVRGEY